MAKMSFQSTTRSSGPHSHRQAALSNITTLTIFLFVLDSELPPFWTSSGSCLTANMPHPPPPVQDQDEDIFNLNGSGVDDGSSQEEDKE